MGFSVSLLIINFVIHHYEVGPLLLFENLKVSKHEVAISQYSVNKFLKLLLDAVFKVNNLKYTF